MVLGKAVHQTTSNILVLCVGTAVAAAVGSAMTYNNHRTCQAEKKRKGDKLELYLMDKIAKKPYLNYHSATSAHQYQQQTKRYRGRYTEEQSSPKSTDVSAIDSNHNRPKGVPSRLRLLTIDVPEFKRKAFEQGSICKVPSEIFSDSKSSSLAYIDGLAPSKSMNKTLGHNERTGTRSSRKPIIQKSLAKELYYCYNPHYHPQDEDNPIIGVEILEASIRDLNPKNIRRTYTTSSRSWKKISYDPAAKYPDASSDDSSGIADAEEAEVEEETTEQQQNTQQQFKLANGRQSSEPRNDEFEEKDIDSPDYEREAPWNQYAWLEEMNLRINGFVPFAEPMQRAHYLSQLLYGRIYHQSVPAASPKGGWMSWIWWPWFGSNLDGVDGEGENVLYVSDTGNKAGIMNHIMPWRTSSKPKLNRASNKPHAVICDGSAMQRVPGSLRFLSKICQEANIGLYILNDPRSWGSQTHSTLDNALPDMRKAISENIIRNALDLREGSAYERGRMVGRLENDLSWKLADKARRTRENLKDARRSLRRHTTKQEDWSTLPEEELLKKLVERKVITLYEDDKGDGKVESCSDGFVGICKECEKENTN